MSENHLVVSGNTGVRKARCMGGMIRRYVSRYDSGHDSPYVLYCLHKDYIYLSYIKGLSPTPSWRLGPVF